MRLFSQIKATAKKKGSKNRNSHRCRLERLEGREMFSAVTAVGDFNGDGHLDLAVGDADAYVGSLKCAGEVQVSYGSQSGTKGATQTWTQNSRGIGGKSERYDMFGSSLAVGDFNGDGFDDLAIGVPGEDLGRDKNAGAVHIIYGSKVGLTAKADQIWAQQSWGIKGAGQSGDKFGSSLVAGDFDGDHCDDLAIGVPGENHDSGAVNIIYGSAGKGLTSYGDQIWSQASWGIKGARQRGDGFGSTLAVGDFDGDGYDDLAIGVPGENGGAGAVNIIYGSAKGLTSYGDQIWSQALLGIKGARERGDRFGSSLAVGNFNGDGYDDLAIGVPGENGDAGAVNVIYGSARGLTSRGDQIWSQASWGIKGVRERGDEFGCSLAAGDFNNDGRDDLAIGVPGENHDAGAVNIIYGSTRGLTAIGNQLWSQNSWGIKGRSEAGDRFGEWLLAGDFDGDGHDDLAVGVPGEDWLATDDGAVNVIYGSSKGLTPKRDKLLMYDEFFRLLGAMP